MNKFNTEGKTLNTLLNKPTVKVAEQCKPNWKPFYNAKQSNKNV